MGTAEEVHTIENVNPILSLSVIFYHDVYHEQQNDTRRGSR